MISVALFLVVVLVLAVTFIDTHTDWLDEDDDAV